MTINTCHLMISGMVLGNIRKIQRHLTHDMKDQRVKSRPGLANKIS